MTSPTIRLPYLYPLEYLPLRGQKARTVLVEDVAEFEIREVPRTDVVDAIVVDMPGGRVARYGYGADLFASYRKDSRQDIMGLDEFPWNLRAGGVRETTWLFGEHLGGGDWAYAAAWQKAIPERPGDIRTVLSDGRDEVLSVLSRKVEGLLVMGGELLLKSPPPMFTLIHAGTRGWYALAEDKPDRLRFGLDRLEAFDAFVERFKEREKVEVTRPGLHPFAINWDLSQYPEVVSNAEYAAHMIVCSAGQILGSLPSTCLHALASLAEAREAIVAGAGQEKATAIREAALRILELHPVKEGTLLKKALGTGIDAIESSRDFVRVELDVGDVEALAGLSMTP